MSFSLDQTLMECNQLGLIPGPNENEPDFIKRAESCLGIRQRIEGELGGKIPLKADELGPREVLERPLNETERLWGIKPNWIPIFFSNYRLLPWHGGCAWIFQLSAQEPPMALFQLRRAFANKRAYLGLYDRDELVAHEVCHVGRMCFQEPRFEEILAYQSSKSWFRRVFGPLFQSSIETVIFLIVLLLVLGVDAYVLFSWGADAYAQVASLKILPLGMLVLGLGRLMQRHWQFARCKRCLQGFFGDETRANHLIYRLTDKEVASFGKRNVFEKYVEAGGDGSLRWRMLRKIYFAN